MGRHTGISFIVIFKKEKAVLENYGIVIKDKCPVYGSVLPYGGECAGEIIDELMSGWLVRIGIPEKSPRRDWLCITTHYGYKGYVKAGCVRCFFAREGTENIRTDNRVCRINKDFADILCEPKVRAPVAATLYRNSFVELLKERGEQTGGWSAVRCADGRVGFIHSVYLSPRCDDDEYFLRGNLLWQSSLKKITDRDKFRRSLVGSAKSYLGTQYRWGGKSPAGLDCSGFVFLCYMENGVLIYRDAKIKPGYPVREVPRAELKSGDLIYWEGHVAMYLGNDRYIHATGNPVSACVTVNSLNPEEEDYRADLADSITAFGSVF